MNFQINYFLLFLFSLNKIHLRQTNSNLSNMRKIPLIFLFFFIPIIITAQRFSENPSEFTGVFYGDCHWFDGNNDNKPDFIISGAEPGYSGFMAVYQNNGNGFSTNENFEFPNIMYTAIDTADLDGNGFTDIIITGTKTGTLSTPVFYLYYNNGDGTYDLNEDSGITPANFGSVHAADFNDDGKIDILVNGQDGSNYITKIYAQQPDGSFIEKSEGLMGTYFSATKVFDANNDGFPDLLITGFSTSFAPDTKFYLNNGDFTFTENTAYLLPAYFSSIDTADLNNDGFLDVLITGMGPTFTGKTTVYLNDGQGNFRILPTEITGVYSGAARFVDYDNDGDKDIFIMGINAESNNTALLYTNNGDGTFTEDTENSAVITGLNMSKAEWADYDSDGDMDLLTIGYAGEIGITKIYTNNSPAVCGNPGPNTGDLGCVTFTYQGTTRTYVTVRANDGNIWIQQNLGSENVAASETDATGFGDLFQFGRWDDGHQLRTSPVNANAPEPNNPIGLNGGNPSFYTSSPEWWANGAITDSWNATSPAEVTDKNGCDPCKALGLQWNIPTQTDWQQIIADENITDIATAYGSNLKLPVAGSRLGTSGNFNFTAQRGYYWSKTPSDNVDYVKYLYYSNFIVNPNAGSPRSQGLSVRCIKKTSVLDYCEVSVDYDVEPISAVVFADIDNQTSAVVNATPAYEDFTDVTTNVTAGQTYPITVQGNTVGLFEHDVRVFFDWNQDGAFDMATEYYPFVLASSTGTDGVTAGGEIAIPADATRGFTRMRIIKDLWNVYEEGEFDACLNAYYGQVEDYTINIQSALHTDLFNKNEFTVYPNPTSGIVSIETKIEIENTKVFNSIGQLITTGSTKTIDLSNLNSGIYIIQIQFKNGQSAIKKVVRR